MDVEKWSVTKKESAPFPLSRGADPLANVQGSVSISVKKDLWGERGHGGADVSEGRQRSQMPEERPIRRKVENSFGLWPRGSGGEVKSCKGTVAFLV